MDCSNGVFSSINRLRWTVKIMLSLLSNFWSRRPYDSNQSAASLTLHENDAVHVQLTSGTSLSNREEERPCTRTYYRFWKSRWNNELRGIGFGCLRSPISINQESEDNIELLSLYHVPCVTLCPLSLSCQTTLTKRQKKKRKKKIVRCQCTTCSTHNVQS